MQIEVLNPNNPGAKFTSNTEKTLVSYYHELKKHKDKTVNFSTFRSYMQKTFGINNSNSRNIFAFCKNCGLLNYENNQGIKFESFFTDLGKAYIKVIESISLLENEKNKSQKELDSLNQFRKLRQNIIFQCLKNLLRQKDCEYVYVIKQILIFLESYKSIDKTEYALLLYYKNKDKADFYSILGNYRNNQISIEVFVNVRDDNTNEKGARTLKGIEFLSSWTYLIGMLNESGLVEKDNQSYVLLPNKTNLIKELLEVS